MAQTDSTIQSHWAELAHTVNEAKARHGALHPVTIIVPNNGSGLDATRFLARTSPNGHPLVNIHAHTLSNLAAELFTASGAVNGRTRASFLIRQAEARKALLSEPGIFQTVATSYATAAAVAKTSEFLDLVDDSVLAHHNFDKLTRQVVTLHRAIRSALRETCYFNDDVSQSAVTALADEKTANKLGTVIFFCVTASVMPRDQTFFEALQAATKAKIIVAQHQQQGSKELLRASRLIQTTDADEECRTVARLIAEEISNGTPGHRIAVFLSSPIPYRQSISRHLDQAAISHSITAPMQLVDTAIARHLIRLLDGASEDALDPLLVADALGDRALFPAQANFPSSTRVERIIRQASSDEDSVENEDEGLVTEYELERRRDRKLFLAYVDDLGMRLRQILGATTWQEAARGLRETVTNDFTPFKGRVGFRGKSDDDEIDDIREKLERAIDTLSSLEHSSLTPTPYDVVAQLVESINAGFVKHGKAGIGVTVTGLNSAEGRDFDKVFFVGLAEGIAPPRVFENPLFSDKLIAETKATIPSRPDRVKSLERNFALAISVGTSAPVITYPLGNLRGGDQRVLSRWVGNHLSADEIREKTEVVGSFYESQITSSPTGSGIPATQQAWNISRIAQEPEFFNELTEDDPLHRPSELRRDRRQGVFSAFNGNLSGHKDELREVLVHGRLNPMSATHAEQYRDAPLSFFLQRILGAHPLNDLVLNPEIDALTRGTLIHEVLEKWVKAGLASEHTWDLDALLITCRQTCDEYRADVGKYWVGQYWELAKKRIETDVRFWHQQHMEVATSGWAPEAAEREFGKRGTADEWPSVSITVNNELEHVHFQGQVDRVDRTPDGNYRVIDYKSGQRKPYETISSENPTAGGMKYQLGVYGKLAYDRIRNESEKPAQVEAAYWFIPKEVSEKSLDTALAGEESFLKKIAINEDAIKRIESDLTKLTNDILNGAFPPKPSESSFDHFTASMGGKDSMDVIWQKIAGSDDLLDITDFWLETIDAELDGEEEGSEDE